MDDFPNFHYHTLDDGLGLALVELPWARSVAVELLLEVGSRHESPSEEGAAHFVEHMLFKGTTKRPKALDLTAQIEALGASVNAWTSQECTAVELSGPKQSLPVLLDAALDMMTSPLFLEAEFEREREVILEEIAGYQDDPAEACSDLLPQALWGKATDHRERLAHPIAGTKASVSALKLEQLKQFHTSHYQAPRATLAIAGNLSWDDLQPLIKTRPQFPTCPSQAQEAQSNKHTQLKASLSPTCASQSLRQQRPDLLQRHLALGWQAPSALSENRYATRMALTALAGTMSSRLFQQLREERGLVYALANEYLSLRDCGSVQLFLEAEAEKMSQALEILHQQLSELATQGFQPAELDCARGYLLGQLENSLDSPALLCRWAAEAGRLEQDIPQPQRAQQIFQKLSNEDLTQSIQDWLTGGTAQAEVAPED